MTPKFAVAKMLEVADFSVEGMTTKTGRIAIPLIYTIMDSAGCRYRDIENAIKSLRNNIDFTGKQSEKGCIIAFFSKLKRASRLIEAMIASLDESDEAIAAEVYLESIFSDIEFEAAKKELDDPSKKISEKEFSSWIEKFCDILKEAEKVEILTDELSENAESSSEGQISRGRRK